MTKVHSLYSQKHKNKKKKIINDHPGKTLSSVLKIEDGTWNLLIFFYLFARFMYRNSI